MQDKVVYDVKEANFDVIIPGVAVNGIAFEDKNEADKFIQKYMTGPKHRIEERVEKPVFASVDEFEKSLKHKLASLKKQLECFNDLKEKYPKEFYDFDKLYLEYSINKIEYFLNNAKEINFDFDTERM